MNNTTKQDLAEAGEAERPTFDSPEAALEAVEGSIPTVATEVYDPTAEIEVDESGLEREFDENEDDIEGTAPVVIKLMQTKAVWDYMNGYQFNKPHSVENERGDTFELEVYEDDHDEFVTGLLDAVGLDAFRFGIMPSLLGK